MSRARVGEQEQFLDVLERDEAQRRWFEAIQPRVLAGEMVALSEALGRVLARDVVSEIDVPGFDRSNVDGFAVCASDTFGASDERPCSLRRGVEVIHAGSVPTELIEPGCAGAVSTGAMLPRGADAVVMVEHTSIAGDAVLIRRPVAPGGNVTFAGTDIARGEFVLASQTRLTSRETGVLAALGLGAVEVVRRPRVAIISTGDELVSPGGERLGAQVYDSNQAILADAVRELGCEAVRLGIVVDDEARIEAALSEAIAVADVVILSGGTSKGAGDFCARVLSRQRPGIVAHGVALRPGKPICLGVVERTPVAVLPGFPTSAIFTFHTFVAPVLRVLAGARGGEERVEKARMPARFNSERGRTDFALVNLVPTERGLAAYPIGKGSGSVTTFSRADGFLTIPSAQEYVEAGEIVEVTPLAEGQISADLIVIGSHCTGLDYILAQVREDGFLTKTLWVGSMGGLAAAQRGECDLAGVHLFDPVSGCYNAPFLTDGVRLLPGYGRMQGVVVRGSDSRFGGVASAAEVVSAAVAANDCLMVNRNRGSGTRVLIDELLKGAQPRGHSVEARSHNAVAAAVVSGRADWGVAIEPVARAYGLRFLPLRAERYDFVIPVSRWDRAPVAAFRAVLASDRVRDQLRRLGFTTEAPEPGEGASES